MFRFQFPNLFNMFGAKESETEQHQGSGRFGNSNQAIQEHMRHQQGAQAAKNSVLERTQAHHDMRD